MVYNGCMSVIAREVADILSELHADGNVGADVPCETVNALLKRLGFKPKTGGPDVYCDIGRGAKRLALRADGYEQTAALVALARRLGSKPPIPLRLIFRVECCAIDARSVLPLDGIETIYSVQTDKTLDVGKIGYCYGVAAVGYIAFSVDLGSNGDRCGACERLSAAIASIADACAVEIDVDISDGKTGVKCLLRFFDDAAGENAIMRIERAALDADDEFGTTHELSTVAAYFSTVNDPFAVDVARSALGDDCTAISPQGLSDGFSEYSSAVRGCVLFVGDGEPCNTALTVYDLYERLVRAHAQH